MLVSRLRDLTLGHVRYARGSIPGADCLCRLADAGRRGCPALPGILSSLTLSRVGMTTQRSGRLSFQNGKTKEKPLCLESIQGAVLERSFTSFDNLECYQYQVGGLSSLVASLLVSHKSSVAPLKASTGIKEQDFVSNSCSGHYEVVSQSELQLGRLITPSQGITLDGGLSRSICNHPLNPHDANSNLLTFTPVNHAMYTI